MQYPLKLMQYSYISMKYIIYINAIFINIPAIFIKITRKKLWPETHKFIVHKNVRKTGYLLKKKRTISQLNYCLYQKERNNAVT